MKFGFSILLQEYLLPEYVDYNDSKIFQIVCPECHEPIFKVTRKDSIKSLNYFSHYKRNVTSDTNCSLRVDALNEKELLKKSSLARGQNLQMFLNVFKETLIINEIKNNTASAREIINHLNNQLGFSKIKLQIANRMIELVNDKEFVLNSFNDFIADTNFKTEFQLTKQKEYAFSLYQMICSEKGKDNLNFLICFSTIYLTELISIASEQRSLEQWEKDLYKYIYKMVNIHKEANIDSIIQEMTVYKIPSSKNTLMNKLISEIAYESYGVLIRFPFFSLLKRALLEK